MSLNKPYFRIARPKAFIPNYVMDNRYASNRIQLSRAYINIERELQNIFNFIEPDERNLNVFSFELYSLLLRACTEVELNCKLILEANGAIPERNHFTMEDYKKIENSSKLSKYKVILRNWRNKDENGNIIFENKELIPFSNFSQNNSPFWYKAYNHVKHNREDNFEEASLENVINAVAGILVLIYSQFGTRCIDNYNSSSVGLQLDEHYDFSFDADTIFDITPPSIDDWNDSELYDFNWEDLCNSDTPFNQYPF